MAGGATTDRQIADVLGISVAAARKRRQRLGSLR